MLTVSQQKLLVSMLLSPVTAKNNRIYNSRAFFRIMGYLMRNGFVESFRTTENYNEYHLTIKGNAFARFLAGLTDVDEKIRAKYGV